jgi:hypothetical protein
LCRSVSSCFSSVVDRSCFKVRQNVPWKRERFQKAQRESGSCGISTEGVASAVDSFCAAGVACKLHVAAKKRSANKHKKNYIVDVLECVISTGIIPATTSCNEETPRKHLHHRHTLAVFIFVFEPAYK